MEVAFNGNSTVNTVCRCRNGYHPTKRDGDPIRNREDCVPDTTGIFQMTLSLSSLFYGILMRHSRATFNSSQPYIIQPKFTKWS